MPCLCQYTLNSPLYTSFTVPLDCYLKSVDDITVFGISYDKADPETRKWMKDVLRREKQIDKGLGYYGF